MLLALTILIHTHASAHNYRTMQTQHTCHHILQYLPFKLDDPDEDSADDVGAGDGGQCCAESASQRSPSSCAASLSQSLLISISLYRGLLDFNHCKAASTFAGRTY